MGYYDPSLLKLKWFNGYARDYNLHHTTHAIMMNDIDTINRYVAYEQACLGQDDELEDED